MGDSRTILCTLAALTAGLTAAEPSLESPAAPDPQPTAIEQLNLEAHGSVSFGYLRTWGNDWTGDGDGGSSENGTTDFWEATANVIARPMDRLRIGAQLFARDLGRYDNGQATLEWAYADYRLNDGFGVQAGRYKIPLGLYNETADIDTARTQVFLPPNLYSFRSRDLYISADGVKIAGYLRSAVGAFSYALHAGRKDYDDEAGFSAFLTEVTGADPGSLSVSSDGVVGASLHWYTPIEGLGLRLSAGDIVGFRIDSTTGGVPTRSTSDHYLQCIASVIWEQGQWEIATEYGRLYTRGTVVVDGVGQVRVLRDNSHSAHFSVTCHVRPWLDLYGSLQSSRREATDFHSTRADSLVAAVRVLPLPQWSLKIEGRQTWGTKGLTAQPDGEPAEHIWQTIALKSTWDF